MRYYTGMKKLVSLSLLVLAAYALADTPSADVVLAKAKSEAARSGRNVLVIFHASWCGWCHKLDGVLESALIKPIIAKHFVTTHLTVMEDEKHKADENAGGGDLMKKEGGEGKGIPFIYVMNPKGKTLINSLMGDGSVRTNTGCPVEPNEIDHWMKMMKAGAPKMTTAEAAAIRKALEAQKKGG